MSFQAVIFDWRGTLVATPSEEAWLQQALALAGRASSAAHVSDVLAAIRAANGVDHRLDALGLDTDADLHRRTYFEVFADAGLDDELAAALYAVESDARYNPFADDAASTLRALQQGGTRVAVLSDIHFDIRPAFTAAGLGGLVDVFTLSYELGAQKPDALVFRRTLAGLGVEAGDVLMVGDRSRPDGAAVEQGLTTLLLPPLRSTKDRRLHHVVALCKRHHGAPG